MKRMSDPYLIRISSEKGGVGKTTVATNMAVALRLVGYKVLLVDFDFSNPSVGFHLGLQEANSGVNAAMAKRVSFANAVSMHGPTGLHVIPGEVDEKSARMPDDQKITSFLRALKKLNYNFIVIDTAPGHNPESYIQHFNEQLIITTPDIPSCAAAVRSAKRCERKRVRHGLVVNKVSGAPYELSIKEIREMYTNNIVGSLTADLVVPASIAAHIPAYTYRKRAKFSLAVGDLSDTYASMYGKEEIVLPVRKNADGSIFSRLFSNWRFWTRRRR